MKTEVITCDICGKVIDYKEYRRFKIKMKDRYTDYYHYDDFSRWYKMDVHDECFKELCRLIVSIRKEREKEFDELLKNINIFAELANKSQ